MEFQLRYRSGEEFIEHIDSGRLDELLELLEARSIQGVNLLVNTPERGGDIQLESLEIIPPRRDKESEGYLIVLDYGISASSCMVVKDRADCILETRRIIMHVLNTRENCKDE